jgi:predicted flap endonuclease-1-like 5' DNA nuclease
MRTNSIARFTAAALIVAAVILFILGIIPVIAVAVGGLGFGWGAGSKLWLVAPLATCVCGGALLLLAFGAMLLVLTRIQSNLSGWRQSQAQAVAARTAAVPTREIETVSLAAAAVAAEPGALTEAETGGGVVVVGEPLPEAGFAGGAALAAAGLAAAVVGGVEKEEPVIPESAPAPEPGAPSVEITELEELPLPAEETGGPGLEAVLAGAGIAAVATREGEVEAEPEGETIEAEAAAAEVQAGASGFPTGAVLAGAAIAAAALGREEGEAEPEPAAIPESTPGPEPGEPAVEFLEAEQAPAAAEERGGAGIAAALAAAELVAGHEGEGEASPEAAPAEAIAPETAAEAAAAAAATAEMAAPEAKPPARSTAWSYDEGTSNVTRAVGAVRVEGVGQVYAGKLKELGITTTAALLRAGATPKGRKELAEKTGISPKQILKWINRVDLARIRGISEQYADLLEAAGVDTVPELAQRNADNLFQKMVEVNEAKRLVRRLPTLGMVTSWITQAKELPRVVVYK